MKIAMQLETALITHENKACSLENVKESIKNRLHSAQLPEGAHLEELNAIVDKLSLFGFGRYLLQNRGINGKWTQYMVLYPSLWKDSLNDIDGKPQTDFERWILTSCPTMLATQERFTIFQNIIQAALGNRLTLASVPCGLMDDLLRLDYKNLKDISLIGIDLDKESLELADTHAQALGHGAQSTFIHADAWAMPLEETVDILTSNGLNIYEPSDERVTALYMSFFKALKPGGLLVTSFLTPPPAISGESPWNFEEMDKEVLRLQRLIFADILQAKWLCYRTEKQMRAQLESAGFEDINFYYDKAKLFPTVTARKPHS